MKMKKKREKVRGRGMCTKNGSNCVKGKKMSGGGGGGGGGVQGRCENLKKNWGGGGGGRVWGAGRGSGWM